MAIADIPNSTRDGDAPRRQAKPDAHVAAKLCRSRIGRLMGVQVIALGSYVPENCVRNEDLAALGYDADWIVKRTGITERRHAAAGRVDGRPGHRGRPAVHRRRRHPPRADRSRAAGHLHARHARSGHGEPGPGPLGALCPGLRLAGRLCELRLRPDHRQQYVATGCSQRALVIGADCNSRILNPADKQTYPFFGDAAGAVVLAPGSTDQGILAYAVGSDGSGAELHLPAHRRRASRFPPPTLAGISSAWMAGRCSSGPFALSRKPSAKCSIRGHGRPTSTWWYFHQANIRIINAAIENCTFAQQGLQQSRPLRQHLVRQHSFGPGRGLRTGRIHRGNHVLFSGFGAGLSWGTVADAGGKKRWGSLDEY